MSSAPDRDFPWWLVALGVAALGVGGAVAADPLHAKIFATLSKGIGVTVFVTLVAFAGALVLGLLLAVASLSRHLI
ncbi:amino acid ABC transporter permease, partial [Candidatus Falkowbacteria bacterium]|nr:amino acid ABC transporter permease [Candidatus Falkowbacteria bacterium]